METRTQPQPLILLPADVEAAARILVQHLPGDTTPVRGQTIEHVTLEVRRLARVGGMARTVTGVTRPELSGGVEVAARVPACSYDPYPGYLSGRMGPGWSENRLQRRIVYMLNNAIAYYWLRCKRDGLYVYMCGRQNAHPDDNLEMAMAEEEAVTGCHSVLRDMDEEDIKYWWSWLAAWHALD